MQSLDGVVQIGQLDKASIDLIRNQTLHNSVASIIAPTVPGEDRKIIAANIIMFPSREREIQGQFLTTILGSGGTNHRQSQIHEAHDQTFQWIFTPSADKDFKPAWDSFVDWLESDSQLYWMTGKAGSGKSTLMKLISHHRRLLHHLKTWSQGQPITIASFYFWASGTAMQASPEGRFRSLLHQLLDQNRDIIPKSIVDKAQGVFLWVSFVVSSLLAGMKHDDRIVDLQRRLDGLPPDLENLYDSIVGSWDPFYFEHAVQYFLLMLARGPPDNGISARIFYFVDSADRDYATKMSYAALSEEYLKSQVETVGRRLNSRYLGLLEVRKDRHSAGSSVEYLDRSVRDYVGKPDVLLRFRAATGLFDPHLELCSAYLAVAKSPPIIHHSSQRPPFIKDVFLCVLTHARRISERNIGFMVRLLDTDGRVISSLLYMGADFNFPMTWLRDATKDKAKNDRFIINPKLHGTIWSCVLGNFFSQCAFLLADIPQDGLVVNVCKLWFPKLRAFLDKGAPVSQVLCESVMEGYIDLLSDCDAAKLFSRLRLLQHGKEDETSKVFIDMLHFYLKTPGGFMYFDMDE
ncbi:hypothetical protein QBC36DRAFT_314514 [Triangularia setosa]|uniref:NACHT domain-containing protein n=1 Tax=Triangularia setosa TaxID=2587417 RepID=A0AAN6W0T0_9PEZI|nr:hypothetical protein QBC36DRAFT_314514 [Podospora setosa]